MYKEVTGNLITLAQNGHFDVITHGCNCFCTMGAGLAPQMAKAFGCDKFKMEGDEYEGDVNKLGTIDWQELMVSTVSYHPKDYKGVVTQELKHNLIVVNSYSQYGFGRNHKEGSVAPLDYEALCLCLRKMNKLWKGKRIGLPQIGCHLAGGDWNIVKEMIQDELVDCDVTVVIYDAK